MEKIPTATLLWLQNSAILLAYSRSKYLPGGKIEPGETAEADPIREIREELVANLQGDLLQWFTRIPAQAYGGREGHIMKQGYL